MDKRIRTLFVALSVAAICLIAFLNFHSASSNDTGPFTSEANALNTSVKLDDAAAASLPDSVPMVHSPSPVANAILNEAQPELTRRGWIAMQGAAIPFKLSDQVREQMAVDVSSADLGKVQSGERVSFLLPDGSEAIARVENTWTENNGDQVWSGHVEDVAGPDYRIVVTQGSNATFASINTSKGSYSLESINGRGVVYKNPEMGDVAPRGTTDYLMPEG